MSEELITMPWVDNDKGHSWWTQTTYSIDEDGTYSDEDGDGIDAAAVPTYEEAQDAWRAYYVTCKVHGTDELQQFPVRREIERKERWQFVFRKTIAGVAVNAVRRAGVYYAMWDVPEHVARYIHLNRGGTSANTDLTVAVMEESNIAFDRWVTLHITHKTPRAPAALARDIRKAANKALKETKP